MIEQTIAHLLGAVVRAMEAELLRRLHADGYADIRAAHFAVFRHLAPDGSRITELAERAQMTKQSVGELVSYLESRGYLQRQPDPSDGRVRIIKLTTRGERSRAAAFEAFRDIETAWRDEVGPRRVAELRTTLAKIAALEPPAPTEASRPAPRAR